MKKPLLIPRLLVSFLLAGVLWQPAFAAEEKADPGPKPSAEEAKAYDELTKRGVAVQPLAANIHWRYVNFRDVAKPDASVFALLKPCSLIVELDLSGSTVSDADLASVGALTNLKRLGLANTPVTDAGLGHLKGLAQLERLNLFHTGITDAGLAPLRELKKLQRLYVFESKVTEAGAKALEQAVPGLKVDVGWKLPPPPAPKSEERKPEPAPASKPATPAVPAPKPEEKKPAPAPAAPAPPKPAEPKPAEKKEAAPAPANS